MKLSIAALFSLFLALIFSEAIQFKGKHSNGFRYRRPAAKQKPKTTSLNSTRQFRRDVPPIPVRLDTVPQLESSIQSDNETIFMINWNDFQLLL